MDRVNLFEENQIYDTAKIKVIGIGGCGNSIINKIFKDSKKEQFIAINTDKNALDSSVVAKKLLIGRNLTKGLGAGANPEIGKKAAEESKEDIEELLEDTDILVMIAGIGGGTGAGATPVIAQIAKQKNILTIGIALIPFSFEGKIRSKTANKTIEELKDSVDTLITINNDNILKIVDSNISMKEGFSIVDEIVLTTIDSIDNLIVLPGFINIDFNDFKDLLGNKGLAKVSIGKGSGENGVDEAFNNLLSSIFLDNSLKDAKSIIFSVVSGKNLILSEINTGIIKVTEAANPDADIVFGISVKEELNDEVIVSIIAAGIENKNNKI